jgi:PIN domain nuclease of toxin-antitoxin system
MILLDTNALIWLEGKHARARLLTRRPMTLYVSPASLLELQLLAELGRLRFRSGTFGLAGLMDDVRWTVDDPPAAEWFRQAWDLGWTRDPFDRLIVAHARLRGWRVATGDAALIAHLPASATVPL